MKGHLLSLLGHRNIGALLMAGALLLLVGSLVCEDKAASSPGIPAPFTNAVPRSVFRSLEIRDPLCPIGYRRAMVGGDGKTAPQQPAVEIKLRLNAMMGGVALLEGGGELEEGKTYQYRAGSQTVEYKVIQITDEAVTIVADGKEQTFKFKAQDLDQFIEKEGSNEKNIP